jgi:hypothetical protein
MPSLRKKFSPNGAHHEKTFHLNHVATVCKKNYTPTEGKITAKECKKDCKWTLWGDGNANEGRRVPFPFFSFLSFLSLSPFPFSSFYSLFFPFSFPFFAFLYKQKGQSFLTALYRHSVSLSCEQQETKDTVALFDKGIEIKGYHKGKVVQVPSNK